MFSNNGRIYIPVSGGTSWVRVSEGSKYSSQERWMDGNLYALESEVNRPRPSAPSVSTPYPSNPLSNPYSPESRMQDYVNEKLRRQKEDRQRETAQAIARENVALTQAGSAQYYLMADLYKKGGLDEMRKEYERVSAGSEGDNSVYAKAARNAYATKVKEEAPIKEVTTDAANKYYNEGGIEHLKYLINHYKSRGEFDYASVAQSVLNAKEKEEAINTPGVTDGANRYYETGGMASLKHLVNHYKDSNDFVNYNIAKRILKQKEELEREEEHNRRMQQDPEYAENYKIKQVGNEIRELEKEIEEQKKIDPFYGQPSSATINERIKAFEYTKGLSYESAKAYLEELKLPKNARFENSKIGADVALKYYFDKVIPLQNKIEQAKAKIQEIETVRTEREIAKKRQAEEEYKIAQSQKKQLADLEQAKLIMESPLEEVVKKIDDVNSPRRMLQLYDAINAKTKKLTELGDVQAKDWESLAKQAQEKHQAINKPSVSIEVLEPNGTLSCGHARIGIYTTDGKITYYGFGSDYTFAVSELQGNPLLHNNYASQHQIQKEKDAEELGRKAVTKRIELNTEQLSKLMEVIQEGISNGHGYNLGGFNCKTWVNDSLLKAGLNTTVNEQISEEEMKELMGEHKGSVFRHF